MFRTVNAYCLLIFISLFALTGCDNRSASFLTQWSIVFDTENLQVHFITKTNPQIRTINLMDINFSCKTPVMLLDIHEKFSGDITKKFKVYSSEYHFDYLTNAFIRWELDLPPESVKWISDFFESFPCKEEGREGN